MTDDDRQAAAATPPEQELPATEAHGSGPASGGVSALAAAILLLPLLRLRHGSDPDAGADGEFIRTPEPIGDVVAGEVPRYASAEALESASYPEPGRRSA